MEFPVNTPHVLVLAFFPAKRPASESSTINTSSGIIENFSKMRFTLVGSGLSASPQESSTIKSKYFFIL